MRRIRSGSAEVEGAVSPDSSSEAGDISNSIGSGLAAGTLIGGASIISSSTTVNGASSSSNLGLILGVSIPLILICKNLFKFSYCNSCFHRSEA